MIFEYLDSFNLLFQWTNSRNIQTISAQEIIYVLAKKTFWLSSLMLVRWGHNCLEVCLLLAYFCSVIWITSLFVWYILYSPHFQPLGHNDHHLHFSCLNAWNNVWHLYSCCQSCPITTHTWISYPSCNFVTNFKLVRWAINPVIRGIHRHGSGILMSDQYQRKMSGAPNNHNIQVSNQILVKIIPMLPGSSSWLI